MVYSHAKTASIGVDKKGTEMLSHALVLSYAEAGTIGRHEFSTHMRRGKARQGVAEAWRGVAEARRGVATLKMGV